MSRGRDDARADVNRSQAFPADEAPGLVLRDSDADARRRPGGEMPRAIFDADRRPCTLLDGGVSERPKEHASKACEVQASVGSNPTATAM